MVSRSFLNLYLIIQNSNKFCRGQEQGSRAGYSGHLAQLTEEVQKLDEDAVASKILEGMLIYFFLL